MAKKPIFYWDTCLFLAHIKGEKREPDELMGLRDVVKLYHSKEINIITSILTKAEILSATLGKDEIEKLENFYKRSNFEMVETDFRVWQLTYEIRNYYRAKKEETGLPTLSIPDSIHLATAINRNVDEMHTFDRKDNKNRRALIPLSWIVADKYKITICKPRSRQMHIYENPEE